MADWVSDFGRWWDNGIGRKLDYHFGESARKRATSNPDPIKQVTDPINKFLYNPDREPKLNDPRKTSFTGWPAGQLAIQPTYRPSSGMSVDDKRDQAMAGRSSIGMQPVTDSDRAASQRWQEQQRTSALLDELLGQMQAKFDFDEGAVDYGPLDAALKARMDNLNGIRGQTKENHSQSDLALEQMHNAVKNEMETKGRAAFQDIGQDNVAALQGASKEAIGGLQAIKNEDMARRAAMLKNIGQGQLAAEPDPNAAILNEAIASTARTNNSEVAEARGRQATNEAFNQNTANSVGQQGAERRSDLTQQLQQIMGRLGTVEAGYHNDYANQKLAVTQRAEDRQYDQWRDRQGMIGDTVNSIQEDARERDRMAQEERIAMQKAIGQGATQKMPGYAGLTQDLSNSGYQPAEIAEGIAVLGEILGSDYMSGVNPNHGYTRSDIIIRKLRERLANDTLATHLGTNWGNMGSSSQYPVQPY